MSGMRITIGVIAAFFGVTIVFCVREYVLVVDSVPRSALVISKNCVRRGSAQFRVEWEGIKYTVDTTDELCETVTVGERTDLFYHAGLDRFFATKEQNHVGLMLTAVLFVLSVVWFFKSD